MSINRKELLEIAALAKLSLNQQELAVAERSMNEIKDMIDLMAEVATEHVPAMSHPNDQQLLLRDDAVTEHDCKQSLLKLSKQADDDYYLVPKVIE